MSTMNRKKMERGIVLLLEGMGCDLKSANYKDTPRRVAKMYKELFTPPRNNLRTFPEKHNGLVLLREHRAFGVCPHHLLPFEMRVHVGYIPDRKVLGLSKLARLVEGQLTAPILQEVLTDRIAEDLFSRTQAKGAGCVISGQHGCMRCRGVKTTGDVVTSSMHGVFLLNPTAREEFLRLIGRP
jgi:GTP cyclohydrolase I